MSSFDVRFLGAGLIDQRYCFEMLKWVIMEVRRGNVGMSRPATFEIDKQGVQFTVNNNLPGLPPAGVGDEVSGQQGSPARCQIHSAEGHSNDEEFSAVRRLSAVQQVRTDFSRVHRFVQLNAARCEFCYLVKPNASHSQLCKPNSKAAKHDAAVCLITCYVFEASSTAELAAVADAFSEARRCVSEPSREGSHVDNIDTLMQVGCSFFEVCYVGRAGITTQTVPLDRIDSLIGDLIQRKRTLSELSAESRKASHKTDAEKIDKTEQLHSPVDANANGNGYGFSNIPSSSSSSTMLLEIADSFVCLINTVSKSVALSREIRNISYVFQGHTEQHSHYIGLVVRENRPLQQPSVAPCGCPATPGVQTLSELTPPMTPTSSPFYAYVLECSEKAVADECMYTLRQAFETTRNRNPEAYRCPECPVTVLNTVVQRIDKLVISHFQLDGAQNSLGSASSELNMSSLQSQLANIVDAVGWWASFDVHRLSALVQETGAPLLSTQSVTNLNLFAALQTALRTDRAQTSLADAILALKLVLDRAQHVHAHVNTSDPVLRDGFLTRSASSSPAFHDANRVQSQPKSSRTNGENDNDTDDSSKQSRGGVFSLFKLKLFGKDNGSAQSQSNRQSDSQGNSTNNAQTVDARLRTQSLNHTSSDNDKRNDETAAASAPSISRQPVAKSPVLAAVVEESRPRAQSDSVAMRPEDSESNLVARDIEASAQSGQSDSRSLSPSQDNEEPAQDGSHSNEETETTLKIPKSVETLLTRRSSERLKNSSGRLSTLRTQNDRRTSMPLRVALQQASNLDDSRNRPSSVRLAIFQRVVNPGFVAPRANERDDEPLDIRSESTAQGDVSEGASRNDSLHASMENRTARDRWRKAIWTIVIKKRSDDLQKRQRAADQDRLSYDDVAHTTTAYADWQAVLANPGKRYSLSELRNLVIAGVPKALRGRIWLFLIDQQKRRILKDDTQDDEAENEENGNPTSPTSPTPGDPSKLKRLNIMDRKKNRVRVLKSVLLEKDNLSDLSSVGSSSSRGGTSFEESIRIYEELLGRLTSREVQRAIMIDLGRTFPQYPYFSSGQGVGQLSLFNLLKAYSLLDPEVGYCQGLGFIVGVLLLHLTEHEAFFALRYFMTDMNFREQYLPNMLGLQIQEYQLEHLLVDDDPALHSHLAMHGVAPSLYASSWFLTLFAANFPIGVVARVFDFLFCDGSIEVVLRIALLLLTEHRELLTSFHSLETIVDCFKSTLPKIAPLQIDRIITKLHDCDVYFSSRVRDYELEFCVTQETQNEMRARVTELENQVDRLRRLLQRAERLLPVDKGDSQQLRLQIREAMSRSILW